MHKQPQHVVFFAGGSGSQNLVRYFTFELGIPTTILVNAYDDGYSTGVLRSYIPGFLGPSDFRKNIVNLIPEDYEEGSAIRRLLEYRFPKTAASQTILNDLETLVQNPLKENYYGFHHLFSILSQKRMQKTLEAIDAFLKFLKQSNKTDIPLADMAFGNLVIAGLFLKLGNNFNEAIEEMHRIFPIAGRVVNISDGENRILVGLRQDGFIAKRESEIVQDHSDFAYANVFLLETPLSDEETNLLNAMATLKEKEKWLTQRQKIARINPQALEELISADLVVAAPGTQFSSLFPSYLTEGLGQILNEKVKAPKVMIVNIGEDFDTSKITARFLFDKATQHFGLEHSPFTHCLVNTPDENNKIFIKEGDFSDPPPTARFLFSDWEDKEKSGKHDPQKVAAALAKILWACAGVKNPFGYRCLSIVIPAYNEETCIVLLLKKIIQLDLSHFKVFTEIIFVDDGSKDRTVSLVKQFPQVFLIEKKVNGGKGSAVKLGIQKSKGDFVVIQDSDLEYEPEELKLLLKPMIESKFQAVYGSRTLQHENVKGHLKFIYKKRKDQYWMAYLGGHLLSFWTFLLYGRYLTDTLTAYKMYDGNHLRSLRLMSNGFELDHEITTAMLKHDIDILEVPISYKPRTHEEGKKISFKDGLIAIWAILRFRLKT